MLFFARGLFGHLLFLAAVCSWIVIPPGLRAQASAQASTPPRPGSIEFNELTSAIKIVHPDAPTPLEPHIVSPLAPAPTRSPRNFPVTPEREPVAPTRSETAQPHSPRPPSPRSEVSAPRSSPGRTSRPTPPEPRPAPHQPDARERPTSANHSRPEAIAIVRRISPPPASESPSESPLAQSPAQKERSGWFPWAKRSPNFGRNPERPSVEGPAPADTLPDATTSRGADAPPEEPADNSASEIRVEPQADNPPAPPPPDPAESPETSLPDVALPSRANPDTERHRLGPDTRRFASTDAKPFLQRLFGSLRKPSAAESREETPSPVLAVDTPLPASARFLVSTESPTEFFPFHRPFHSFDNTALPLPAGIAVRDLGRSGDWHAVQLASGEEGIIPAAHLRPVTEPEQTILAKAAENGDPWELPLPAAPAGTAPSAPLLAGLDLPGLLPEQGDERPGSPPPARANPAADPHPPVPLLMDDWGLFSSEPAPPSPENDEHGDDADAPTGNAGDAPVEPPVEPTTNRPAEKDGDAAAEDPEETPPMERNIELLQDPS